MFYTIMEKIDNLHIPLRDKRGYMFRYKTEKEANDERIYLQPDYDNLLKVIGIK